MSKFRFKPEDFECMYPGDVLERIGHVTQQMIMAANKANALLEAHEKKELEKIRESAEHLFDYNIGDKK